MTTVAGCEYETLRVLLFRFARRRGARDPEDVAAEVLARCWERERRGQALNRSYALAATERMVIDQHRHEAVVRRRGRGEAAVSLERLREATGLEPTAAGPDAGRVDAERLLGLLSERQRAAVALRGMGYSHREVGAAMGISEESAKQLAKWARKRLLRAAT